VFNEKIFPMEERTLEVKVNNDVLKGNVECLIARGKRSPKTPFFCLHEYKKEIDSSNDPWDRY
jgi:hypothetical protein